MCSDSDCFIDIDQQRLDFLEDDLEKEFFSKIIGTDDNSSEPQYIKIIKDGKTSALFRLRKRKPNLHRIFEKSYYPKNAINGEIRKPILTVNLWHTLIYRTVITEYYKTKQNNLLPVYFTWLSRQTILSDLEKAMLYLAGLYNFPHCISYVENKLQIENLSASYNKKISSFSYR